MARLRIRIPVIDSDGTRQPGATVKLYAAGTASTVGSPASSTTGTPFAGALYAANSGGSALGTTAFTADANGDVVVFTETAARADVGVEISGVGARVFPLEEFFYDPADIAPVSTTVTLVGAQTLEDKTLGAQTLIGAGTTGAPSLAKDGDTDTGLNLPSTANLAELVSGGVAAIAANIDSATAMVKINRDGDGGAGLLSVQHSNGSGGVASDLATANVIRYSAPSGGENIAVRGSNHAVDGVGGTVTGGEFLADAQDAWDPTGGFVIGLKADANTYLSDTSLYGANIFASAIGAVTGVTVVGLEVDPGGRVGSAISARYGVQAVSNDSAVVQASGEDVAFRVAAKSSGSLWKTGLLIDSNGGKWCMDPAGVLIDARTGGNAAIGIDFSTVTFTDAFIKGPQFRIGSIGRMHVGANTSASGTMLKITNQLDDTHNFEIINPVTQTTVGAAGGASALPATPTGYLLARLGATDVAIPYYLKS